MAGRISVTFIFGTRGLDREGCASLQREVRAHGDTMMLDAVDDGHWQKSKHGTGVGSIDKTLAWYMHAARTSRALFVGKADDDTFVHLTNVAEALRDLHHRLGTGCLVLAGWVQYSSFASERFQMCGWATGVAGAVTARDRQCTRRRWGDSVPARPTSDDGRSCSTAAEGSVTEGRTRCVAGPFPFVAGALEIVSIQLARAAFTSSWTARFVRRARGAAAGGLAPTTARWLNSDEDPVIGYVLQAVARQRSLPVRVVAYNGAGIALPLIADMPDSTPARHSSMLAIHRVDPSDSALRAAEAAEDRHNRELARYHLAGRSGNFRRMRLLNRQHRGSLEQMARHVARRPRRGFTLRCHPALNASSAARRSVGGSDLETEAAGIASLDCCARWSLCEHTPALRDREWRRGHRAK